MGRYGSREQQLKVKLVHINCQGNRHYLALNTTNHLLLRLYNDVIMSAMASQISEVYFVCSTVGSGADQRKHQSSASLAFVWGIHRWPVHSPHKMAETWKMFPFDDVIILTLCTHMRHTGSLCSVCFFFCLRIKLVIPVTNTFWYDTDRKESIGRVAYCAFKILTHCPCSTPPPYSNTENALFKNQEAIKSRSFA